MRKIVVDYRSPIVSGVAIDHHTQIAGARRREPVGLDGSRRATAIAAKQVGEGRAVGRALEDEMVDACVALVPGDPDRADLIRAAGRNRVDECAF